MQVHALDKPYRPVPIKIINAVGRMLERLNVEPVTLQPGMRSFMRLMQRRNVDFPQPEGPINAVTERGIMSSATPNNACFVP